VSAVLLTMAAVLLAGVLAFAVVRPRGLPEAVAAVPAAVVVVAVGAVGRDALVDELSLLGPVVAFLGAILLVSELCDVDGLFRWAGATMAEFARGSGVGLLRLVFLAGAVVTAVLSLDATVVLLTPVVYATAARVGLRPRPHVYACSHLANGASLLLPVSNLTNLLACAVAGLGFARFAALMALPWVCVLAVEYVALRRWFAGDLSLPATGSASATAPDGGRPKLPVIPVVVLSVMLVGFVASSVVHVEAMWVAAAAAVVLAVRATAARRVSPRQVLAALNLPFLAFVLSLGIVVRAVVDNGLAGAMGHLVPGGAGLTDMLWWAGLAAVLANLVNNLPAVLVLLPLAAPAGVGAVLAVIIGVNVGPNLTYVGSLATLLWRRIVHAHGHEAPVVEFTTIGLIATPAAVIVAVVALWASLALFPGGTS
jgi:arsenical pump membrane protein